MKRYVLGFFFSSDLTKVVLVKKNRPDWQKGKWNGVGGHVEDGEDPLLAMIREFREETSHGVFSWVHFGEMLIEDLYEMDLFVCAGDAHACVTSSDEEIRVWDVSAVLSGGVKLIGNIRWLLLMARAVWTGEERTQFFSIHEADVV